MICHGVEISLDGAGEEMVAGLAYCHFVSFFFFFVILRSLF